MTVLVRLEGVAKRYPLKGRSDVVAVDNVNLEVESGEVLGIIGYSGAGKSTLVRLINALEKPSSGRVFIGDHEITALSEAALRHERRNIGMIFQQFNLFHSRTVAGNVAYPLKVAGTPRDDRDRQVARLLDFVGLLSRAHDRIDQLSGGQKQRVGIARALATNPRLLLADEATSALDPETTAEVLGLLRRINRELGVTIVLITHEMEAIKAIADRVAVMESGRIVELGSTYEVFSHPQTRAAERFVRTVLQDRPSPATLARLQERHHGRIITVRLPDERGFQSRLTTVFAAHRVEAEIVFGGIDELQERPLGSLSYVLDGDPDRVEAALSVLRESGVSVVDESSEVPAAVAPDGVASEGLAGARGAVAENHGLKEEAA